MEVHVYPENKTGLSAVYNSAIAQYSKEPCIFVFAHDDLYILDFYWISCILNGLNHFGIVGCVGNKSRRSLQASWIFINDQFELDESHNFSGIIGHGTQLPVKALDVFGPPFQEVKLLDGVFLAVFSETLVKNHLRFDEQFNFHFYDMDFCRQAEIRGVSMATILLSLVHQSSGNPSSDSWRQAYKKYIDKWRQ